MFLSTSELGQADRKKGDHVLAGQKIAEAGGFVSAPIHSSVSGTVKGIEKRLTAVGAMGDAIIIENDGLYESVEYAPAKLSDLSKEDILKGFRKAELLVRVVQVSRHM